MFARKCSWASSYYDDAKFIDGGGKENKMEDMEFEDGVFPRMLNEIEEINKEVPLKDMNSSDLSNEIRNHSLTTLNDWLSSQKEGND